MGISRIIDAEVLHCKYLISFCDQIPLNLRGHRISDFVAFLVFGGWLREQNKLI